MFFKHILAAILDFVIMGSQNSITKQFDFLPLRKYFPTPTSSFSWKLLSLADFGSLFWPSWILKKPRGWRG